VRYLHDLPIRRKLTVITILTVGGALLLACGSFVGYELVTYRATLTRQVSTTAAIVSRLSTASLVFRDPQSADRTLEALLGEPRVVSAAIYTAEGDLFASYQRAGAAAPPSRIAVGEGPRDTFTTTRLVLHRPIDWDGGTIGALMIETDLAEVTARLRRYALIALSVLGLSLLVAHRAAARLHGSITGPVQELAATAEAISTGRDYAVRARGAGGDELGQLTVAFNHMLDEIQGRDEALKTSATKYRLLFDAHPNPMWVYDPASLAFLAVNQAAVRLYGYSKDEFRGMTVREIHPPEDAPMLLERLERSRDDLSRLDGLWTHRRKDGSGLDVEVVSSDIEFDRGAARLVMATDVSDRRKLEAQLAQAQKMEAMGRLAGGVAHDFNNLLGVITGYSELLERSRQVDGAGQKRLEQIQKAAHRAAALTRQLLAFSRKEVIQPRVLDLNEVVGDVERMLRRLIGEDVVLVTKLGRDLGRVLADRSQVDQILMNLAINARDAMPDGGNLWIETSNARLDASYLRTHADVRPGSYVMLAVSDTGHGMDQETLSHVFEPFFTTKGEGKGTGLGLATVFGIAKQSGGHVSVYSEPGRGTTFRVYLPIAEAREAPVSAPVEPSAPPGGSETVLLVEDSDSLRPMIREVLAASGYEVLDSADPVEAAGRARAHPGSLDLVLTDVIMPGMSGPDLVKVVRAARPSVRVLFMSGYTNDAIGRQGVLDPGVHLLQKPFTTEALLVSVRTALDQAGLPRAE
jgi:hypothetical protein